MTTETTEVHYVVRHGLYQIGKDENGQPIAYRAGDVLPPEIGAASAEEDAHVIEIRPGHKDPSPSHNPNNGAQHSAGPAHVQRSVLNEADIEAIRGVVAQEQAAAQARADEHEQMVTDADRAERERVERAALSKKGGRR